jgi:hypothetical protein
VQQQQRVVMIDAHPSSSSFDDERCFFFEDFLRGRDFLPKKQQKNSLSFERRRRRRRRREEEAKKKFIREKKMASPKFNFDELAEALSSQREEMKTKETKENDDWQNHPMFWEKGENGNCEDWFDENSDEFQALKALLHDDDDLTIKKKRRCKSRKETRG